MIHFGIDFGYFFEQTGSEDVLMTLLTSVVTDCRQQKLSLLSFNTLVLPRRQWWV